MENAENLPAVRFVGFPDGPKKFVAELGCEVGTFKEKPKSKVPCLMWHVPLKMRGHFRPEDLANYDPEKMYRTDVLGRVICYGKKADGTECTKRAENRYPRCAVHGGRLHPLDKTEPAANRLSKEEVAQGRSRYQQYLRGELTVDDLDDEELATASFRSSSGRLFKPKSLPRDLIQGFMRAIFDRAQTELRTHTVDAAKTMAEIMMNKRVDPEIRLKAANLLLERNLGKTPQVVAITAQAPWEEIFDGITSGTRESSRERRAIEAANVIDADLVEHNPSSANGQGDNGIDADIVSDSIERDAADSTVVDGLTEENQNSDESPRDQRLFRRDPAILAQEIELKSFEYKNIQTPPTDDE